MIAGIAAVGTLVAAKAAGGTVLPAVDRKSAPAVVVLRKRENVVFLRRRLPVFVEG